MQVRTATVWVSHACYVRMHARFLTSCARERSPAACLRGYSLSTHVTLAQSSLLKLGGNLAVMRRHARRRQARAQGGGGRCGARQVSETEGDHAIGTCCRRQEVTHACPLPPSNPCFSFRTLLSSHMSIQACYRSLAGRGARAEGWRSAVPLVTDATDAASGLDMCNSSTCCAVELAQRLVSPSGDVS